ncbi:MAG: guanylate kinase [Chloroflexi bacterium]|nr:guanylate kinase [Chloroflexota bacterium]
MCDWLLHRCQPLLVVLSGPSGVGKDAVLNRMKRLGRPFHFTVTATTRPRRENERHGVDYLFLSREEFEAMMERGEFLEWKVVYDRYLYGVPKAQVREALGRGQDVIVKPDVQGAASIRELVPDVISIFLAPPSMAELERRLCQRKTESAVDLQARIRTAYAEMKRLPEFDYVVVNNRLDDAAACIDAIVTAEKARVRPHQPVV